MDSTRPRSYTSTLRTQQAALTRQRILDAAAFCFADQGYGRTTLAMIAQRAEVSVETVQGNGPKKALLLAAFEQAFAGDEGVRSLAERPAAQDILMIRDPDEFLAQTIAFIAAANERSLGLWRAFVSAADTDLSVRASMDDLMARRRRDFKLVVHALIERGATALPVGTTPAPETVSRWADVLSFLMSPEGYQQLVAESGWTMADYTDWVKQSITANLR